MLATYLSELVESQRCEEGTEPTPEQFARFEKALKASIQLLEVFQSRVQAPPERVELLEKPPEAPAG